MESTPDPQPPEPVEDETPADGLAQLPRYARSLLKIKVPVTVILAETRIALTKITELAPGSIIQFKKNYDAPLSLEVRDQRIAEGEAVKVGDKFGLSIQKIAMPDERFWVIHGRRSNDRAK